METINPNSQQKENSVLIANCPLVEYGEYIVSATSPQSSPSEFYLSFYIFDPSNSLQR